MFTYIRSHWRGDLSLAQSFWVNGVGLNFLGNLYFGYFGEHTDLFEDIFAVAISFACFLILNIWMLVGLWRVAARNRRENRMAMPPRRTVWAFLVQAWVVVGCISLVVVMVPNVQDSVATISVANSDAANQFYIEYLDDGIVLNGYINDKSVKIVSDWLGENDGTALVLNSPGGFVGPAFDLADFVRDRDVTTVAYSQCASSCLLVLSAAPYALTAPDAVLAFHHPEITSGYWSSLAKENMERVTEDYYARFRAYGVPDAALAEFRKLGTAPMSIADAYTNYIVDGIWDYANDEIRDVEDYCTEYDCTWVAEIL
ncbi:MAG: hypothetical protein ACTS3R_08880 [Inquilinaceae bacterium]